MIKEDSWCKYSDLSLWEVCGYVKIAIKLNRKKGRKTNIEIWRIKLKISIFAHVSAFEDWGNVCKTQNVVKFLISFRETELGYFDDVGPFNVLFITSLIDREKRSLTHNSLEKFDFKMAVLTEKRFMFC